MCISWLVTTVTIHPASWSDPIGWLVEAVNSQSKHALAIEILFDGQTVSSQALPWFYLLKWGIITIPLIFQVTFICGLVMILTKYREFSDIQRACVVLTLLQIFFLTIFAVVKNSTMYDGMRHFLFTLPGIASISTATLVWFYKSFRKRERVLAAILATVVLCQICFDTITLHPYEYVYFNRIVGGLPGARNHYETDYWGLSMREGMEWINENGDSDTSVVVGGPLYSAEAFADPTLTVAELDYDLQDEMEISKPFYYLSMPKHGLQDVFPECRIVYQVLRQATPLTIIKQCN
jgi:hypothetical protein